MLIVEDEEPIADDLRAICARILREKPQSIHQVLRLEDAVEYINRHPIDVLLLDLNLSGKDGFELLKRAVSYSFHTIVISANINRALEAFEYGVVDFIPKPYNEQRIRKALDRLRHLATVQDHPLKYLAIRKHGNLRLICLEEIEYIAGAGAYAEVSLKDGRKELHDKTLNELEKILPPRFYRIHKSTIVDVQAITSLKIRGGGDYRVELNSGTVLPVSRARFADLKKVVTLL
jgi:two-component system, LytTR family, response regulator LytT